jgi:hypothetical protein
MNAIKSTVCRNANALVKQGMNKSEAFKREWVEAKSPETKRGAQAEAESLEAIISTESFKGK